MTRVGNIAADQLRSYIQRIERLHEQRTEIIDDIRDVFAEAKGNGFDVPTMREIIKLRRMDEAERQEKEHMRDLYAVALGMAPQGDLFDEPADEAA
jgi:uncharacterized protein (UPF0335 family)